LVVVFDDIHWAEPAFLDLIEHVADLSRAAPILLLCLARPELLDRRPGWGGGKLNATTVLLEPLSATQTDELLERLLGEATLGAELQERIRDAAEGNPLFVEEMVAFVEASGDGEVTVPGTIQALLAARLDQLEPAERGVLERGSVEGRTFHRGAVQALAPEETQVESRLTGLVRKELVRPDKAQLVGEDAYRFRHLLIRDAAYEALPKATRAELHELFANWLAEHGTELVELDEILGYHLEQAHRYRTELGNDGHGEVGLRAAERLASAGRRSLTIGDATGAANLLTRAVALAEPRGKDGVELLLELALALADTGNLRQARLHREEALELASSLGDRALELRARCDLDDLRILTDPSLTAEQALERGLDAIRELEPIGDHEGLAAAWNLVAFAENLRGTWTGMVPALERVAEHARLAGNRRRESEVLFFLGPAIFWGPTPVSVGLPRAEAIVQSAGTVKWGKAWASRAVVGFYGMQGRFEEGRELVARASSTLEELGRPIEVYTLAFWSAPLELLAGDPVAAEREAAAACDGLEAAGETGFLSTMASMLAEALYAQGRLDEAEAAALRSREISTSDDFNAQAAWRAAYAKILARRGELEEGERLAREAVEIIDRSDELSHQGDWRVGLAEVLRLAGRTDESIPVLRDALERYEQKENRVAADTTRALLAEAGG
ncbi:MAG TPA: tetratricopeptide repeat protein, partial [Gaiellaceae bacterium]|nr:tetratricopeptide repeat protein [Gaiellaceae bacterium]